MSNERTALYEGMFLFPQSATANLQNAVDHLKGILDKCGVSIINFSKWDDRRLAYEIDGNKRGVYFLVYFNAPTSKMSELERRCNQSEEILRMMVTRAENLPSETIEANEGAQALADEIKLRSEQKTEASSGKTGSTVSRKEDDAPAPKPKKAPKAVETAETDEVVQETPEDVKEVSEEVSEA
ncbi:MAG: 30S ribosomal protein S6 [Planctomycetes bacterium]|nr:30S ribosomal protein S6 [Planctomycetota bacterium]